MERVKLELIENSFNKVIGFVCGDGESTSKLRFYRFKGEGITKDKLNHEHVDVIDVSQKKKKEDESSLILDFRINHHRRELVLIYLDQNKKIFVSRLRLSVSKKTPVSIKSKKISQIPLQNSQPIKSLKKSIIFNSVNWILMDQRIYALNHSNERAYLEIQKFDKSLKIYRVQEPNPSTSHYSKYVLVCFVFEKSVIAHLPEYVVCRITSSGLVRMNTVSITPFTNASISLKISNEKISQQVAYNQGFDCLLKLYDVSLEERAMSRSLSQEDQSDLYLCLDLLFGLEDLNSYQRFDDSLIGLSAAFSLKVSNYCLVSLGEENPQNDFRQDNETLPIPGALKMKYSRLCMRDTEIMVRNFMNDEEKTEKITKYLDEVILKYDIDYQIYQLQLKHDEIHTRQNLLFLLISSRNSKLLKEALDQYGYSPHLYYPGFDPVELSLKIKHTQTLEVVCDFLSEESNQELMKYFSDVRFFVKFLKASNKKLQDFIMERFFEREPQKDNHYEKIGQYPLEEGQKTQIFKSSSPYLNDFKHSQIMKKISQAGLKQKKIGSR